MNALTLTLKNDRDSFEPGERLEGVASWSLETPPSNVEARLFWVAEGDGSRDLRVVDAYPFDSPGPSERRDFEFVLPDSPCGFSGNLFSIQWAMELVADHCAETGRIEFVMAPGGEPMGPS